MSVVCESGVEECKLFTTTEGGGVGDRFRPEPFSSGWLFLIFKQLYLPVSSSRAC